MTTVMLKGKPIQTIGTLPKVGSKAPDFKLTTVDLAETSLKDFAGKRIILSIFPSVDTGTCAMAVRHFNEAANKLNNVVILCVSADLPFAQKRFCGAEHLENVKPLSCFRHPEFGKQYGVTITDGPLAGLMSRAVIIIDEKGLITYTQQVDEITNEPNYDAALKAVQ